MKSAPIKWDNVKPSDLANAGLLGWIKAQPKPKGGGNDAA